MSHRRYKNKMEKVLKEVCEKKGYVVQWNGLSDNPNSVQINRLNELFDSNDRTNGCMYPIQLEVWGGPNTFVYRDYRYDWGDERLGELSDYVSLKQLIDVIENNGDGDSYSFGKIKEWEVV